MLDPRFHVENRQNDLKIDTGSVVQVLQALFMHANLPKHSFHLYLVTTEEIISLHKQYFNDDQTTDCISFPIDPPEDKGEDLILGEVFVCPQTAIEYAKQHHLDPYQELLLYIVHGFLHCLGLDDIEEKDEALMREKEDFFLSLLKKGGKSLDFHSKTIP